MKLKESRTYHFRTSGSDGLHLTGHAAVFEQLSVPMWGWREQIAVGAFDKTLSESPDVRMLWNHDSNLLLARTKSDTLTLGTDEEGLTVDADMAPTSYAKDLSELMQRGDLDQMSFGFWIIRDSVVTDEDTGDTIRTLLEISLQDGDVSPVTFPAYPQTDAQVAQALRFSGQDPAAFTSLFQELHEGKHLSPRNRDAIKRAGDELLSLIETPAADPPAEEVVADEPALDIAAAAASRERVLQLLEAL